MPKQPSSFLARCGNIMPWCLTCLQVEKPFADLSRLLLRELRHEDMGAYLMAVEDSKGQIGEEGWPKKRPPRSHAKKSHKQEDADDCCESGDLDEVCGDGEELKIEKPVERPTATEDVSRNLDYLTVGRV